VTIPSGERAKTLRSVEHLLGRMLELRLPRQSTVVALGGGVVGDVAGFAASIYLRGIRLVQGRIRRSRASVL
jgi:3-dehydroquinate synthase